jgi:hypothetical protein
MNRIHRGFPPFPHKTRKGWGTHFRGRERVGVPPELAKSSGRTGGSAEPMGWYRGFPPFPHKTRKGWGTHFKDRERVGVPPELAKSSGGTGGSAEPMGWYRGFPGAQKRGTWGTHLQWLYSFSRHLGHLPNGMVSWFPTLSAQNAERMGYTSSVVVLTSPDTWSTCP